MLNENDFRYYIRAGSNSQPASDNFLRLLFGKEPQPDVFLFWGVSSSTPIIEENGNIKLEVNIILRNRGENVAKNINGYVLVGGRNMELQIYASNEFSYYKNSISGLKISFTAKQDFILGIEQEIQPLIMRININKPITENGIQILALVNANNQPSYRIDIEVSRKRLEEIYNTYTKDEAYNLVDAILIEGNSSLSSEKGKKEITQEYH